MLVENQKDISKIFLWKRLLWNCYILCYRFSYKNSILHLYIKKIYRNSNYSKENQYFIFYKNMGFLRFYCKVYIYILFIINHIFLHDPPLHQHIINTLNLCKNYHYFYHFCKIFKFCYNSELT